MIKKSITTILIIALIFSIISCSPTFKVKTERIEMTVGDYVDLCDYIEGDFSLEVDNSAVMIMCDSVLYASEEGDAKVTVKHMLDSVTIDVHVKKEAPSLTIMYSTPLYTTVKGSIIEFTASSDTKSQIVWSVNGDTAGVGSEYSLRMHDYGKFEVTATSDGQSDTVTAVCYEGFIEPPSLSLGEETGDGLKFTVSAQSEVAPEIVWCLDGADQPPSEKTEFIVDQVGEHTISATVNGIKTEDRSAIISGAVVPTDVRCDFDTDYPNVWLRWNGPKADYEVTVGDLTFPKDDSRFDGNSFDLTGLVDLKNSVSLSVSGNGGDRVTIASPVISDEEEQYLGKKYIGGNYYMTSDSEVYDFISYAMIFRPNINKDKISFSLYLGYENTESPAILLSRGWSLSEQTGSYSLSARGSEGRIAKFSITFFTVGSPDSVDSAGKEHIESLVTPSFLGGLTSFPVDSFPLGCETVTSDQLFYVVEKGFRPLPVSGSASERIYNEAKEALGNIISPSMSDYECVRAIFDYIMWQVAYDYDVVSISDVSEAVRQPAYYLEGVFETGFAVCDGIAKAMSLMCNMMDIDCIRVVGLAVRESPARHAWNKVLLDGEWYIVDATWSDSKISMGRDIYEGGLHNYFLLTDAQMPTHIPFDPELYPKADTFYEYSDIPYLEDTTEEAIIEAISSAAKNINFSVNIGGNETERDFCCLEIKLSVKAREFCKLIRNRETINKAMMQSLPFGSATFGLTGNTLLIYLSIR